MLISPILFIFADRALVVGTRTGTNAGNVPSLPAPHSIAAGTGQLVSLRYASSQFSSFSPVFARKSRVLLVTNTLLRAIACDAISLSR